MKKRKCFVAGFLMVALTTFFGGCGKVTDGISETTAMQIADFTNASSIQLEEAKDVYVITKVHNTQYWQELCRGAQQAGDDLGCNIFVGGTLNELDIEGQLYLMEEAMAAGADAILVAPTDSNVVYEPIQEFMKQGVPVILVDTITNSNDFDVCFMTDNIQAGRMAAQDMLEKLKEAGHSEDYALQVGIQIGSRTSQTIVERVAGFYEYWTNYAPEKWTLLEEIYCNDGDISKAEEMAEEMLAEHVYLKGVVGCNNGSTVGLATHLKEMQRKDVVLVGFDFSDEVAQLIYEEDYPVSTVVQQQYEMGYQGVLAAMQIIKGETPQYKFVDTQVQLVDFSNVEKYVTSLQ